MASAAVDMADVMRAIGELEGNARDLSEPMAIIAESLVSRVNDKFESGGPGWAPLAASTIASRRKSGKGAQILKDTGRLAGSIEAFSGGDYAEAATDVEYAIYHVSDEPREKIPKRDFFDVLTDDVMDEAAETLIEYLTR